VVQARAFLADVTMALEATTADGEVRQLRLQLQRQLMSPEVAACLVGVLDCCLLPLPDGSYQHLQVGTAQSTPHPLHAHVSFRGYTKQDPTGHSIWLFLLVLENLAPWTHDRVKYYWHPGAWP
jgi:hypothetical protein